MFELQKLCCKKGDEKSTHFRSSGTKKRGQKRKEEDPFALIYIGVMRFISPDVTTPVRGKTLPLEVRKDSGYAEVFADSFKNRPRHHEQESRMALTYHSRPHAK